MALRYQCEVVEGPQESDDEIDPWDLDDEEVAVHLRALGREQFWSDPVRLEIVRKRRDDWGNELVVQVEPDRVDELLDLVA